MSSTTGAPRLLVQTAPFLRHGVTTPRLMVDVLLGLAPVMVASILIFGLSAILVTAAAAAGAMFMEAVLGRSGPGGRSSLRDGSAALTGVLLGLTLPPGFPMWMAFLGGVAGIGLGKLIWGGLGHNLFNPALVGRAFLQAAFPIGITTWSAPAGPLAVRASNLAWPFMQAAPDAVTTATPLGLLKFSQEHTGAMGLFLGNVSGSLGETSALAILLGGLWLAARRTFDWRIPVSIFVTVGAFAGILHLVDPIRYGSAFFMLFSGGLMFGAVYMATDPVTSPLAPKGAMFFGAGVGVLVVLIRVWGGLPEGVMYAILLMNAVSPMIERATQQRAFGHGRRRS